MALPPAKQDISEHPQAGSVTTPTDKDAQSADVERKMRLYEVIEALRQGRMPNNTQIDKALSYLRHAEPVAVNKLSPDGRKLIQDCRDIIETARLIVKSKNADELFQNFIWHTREIDSESVITPPAEAPQVEHDRLSEEGRLAVRHLRTLLSLILTNSEVRKLLSDFSVIGRDLLAKGAAKVAEVIRPDEGAITQVDRAAPEGEFVTKGGRKAGPEETPHPKADEPVVGTSQGEEATGSQALGEGKKTVQSAQEVITDMGARVAEKVEQASESSNESDALASSAEEYEQRKPDLKERLKGAKDKLAERFPKDQKRHVAEQIQKGGHILADEYFPAERRDQFIYRGKKIIVECQQHSDYQDAIRWLLSVAEEYAERGQIFDSIGALNDDAHRDEEFRAWFKRLNAFIRKLLLEAGYVLRDDCTREGREIRESGRKFWDQKYRSHFDNVFNSIGDWFSAMGEDPLNKRFGEDWQRLTRDLLFDNEGGLKFKSELWSDIRSVILPTLVDKVGYFPIPRIEYSDDALDLVLENLTLQAPITVSLMSIIMSSCSHLLRFRRTCATVAFYFRKKTGFPRVEDSGVADVIIGGSGVTAIVHLVSAGKDRSSVFKVKDVHVKVGSLKFSIRDSKHDLLYKTLKPLATGMEYLDGQLVSVRDHMEEAKSSDETNRTQVLQELFKRHKDEHSIRLSESKSQFKVVSSKRSSMIDTRHPSAWASHMSESKQKAMTGTEWRSEAFTIV
ncbi:hypothetical protein JVU11DRAFT_9586 [Chiua virens]|nr:hypothetical protein JVU11DRAFT_9586 [Chiua virens]